MQSLTTDQLRAFGDRGFCVVKSVVSPATLAAAKVEVSERMKDEPPPAATRGGFSYWLSPASSPALVALVNEPGALSVVNSLIHPLRIAPPTFLQVALNIPPHDHVPGGGHIDGLTPPEESGRPGTYTVIAGFLLSDQSNEGMGNLWVWPGSHHVIAAHLKTHGPWTLFDIVHPPFPFSPPERVCGQAGDLYLGHYLLSHNWGGNVSKVVRQMVYFRLQSEGHAQRWEQAVQDPLLEFAPVRSALS